MSDAADLPKAVEAVSGAVGLAAWGADVGHGSFLTAEFGAPRADDPQRGEYHLWIYLAAWRIEQAGRVIVSSEDDELAGKVSALNGRTLQSVAFEHPSLSTVFRFDGDTTLTTFSIYTTGEDHWMLYRPDGLVFTAGPGSAWSLEPGDAARD